MAENQKIVSFNYGLKKDLPEQQEGQLLFATDSKQIYIDIDKKRHNFGLVQQAEDNESLIIGEGKGNIAGTKGFVIEKAQRITQEDGSYKYYYYLRDNNEVSLLSEFQKVLDKNNDVEKGIYVAYTLRLYHFSNTKFEDGTYKIAREYADDYAETYSVEPISIKNTPYLKVEVEKVKRTYQPVPDSGVPSDDIRDEEGNYRYIWKPTGDSDIYEISYTDTYIEGLTDDTASAPNTPAYSYFRLSVAPELGTNWLPTNGLVVGGSNNQALGKDAFTAGSDNISNGSKSITLGDENYANYSAVAAGKKNKALNKYDVALGQKNEVNAWAGFAGGQFNEVKHTASGAIGQYLKTHNSGHIALGAYNKSSYTENIALSVGVGTSNTDRKDAMTVYKDGTTKILGDVYSGDTNITQVAKDAKAKADAALENKTVLQLGKLPEVGELNKLYINDQDELWIYKIRKTPKVENVWDGTTVKPTEGTGTETDPYLIYNAAELHWAIMNENISTYFKLANDIYINDIIVDATSGTIQGKETAKAWVTFAKHGAHFKGILDGDNHVVGGIYINETYDGDIASWNIGMGLIPQGACTIKNIGIVNSYINAPGAAVAAFIGSTNNNSSKYSITNSFVGEDVILSGTNVGGFVGGGDGQYITKIENCYCLAIISATSQNFWGAINGQVWSCNNVPVTNCYTNTRLYGQIPMKFTNCYSTEERSSISGVTILTADNMTGISALDNMPNLGDAFVNDYTYPHLKSFAEGWHKITPKF